VQIQGLRKSFGGQPVVDGVDLAVYPGECFGILGPNGAGKTTTLRMLLGLTPPDSGELSVLTHSVPRQARRMRRRVGIVPQQDNLDPDFTVRENLLTYASYFGLGGPALVRHIEDPLAFASLEQKADAHIATLSGGMKRRLILARALINTPELIILDEPTTGLDPQARQLIWQRLRALLMQGKTLILTTHYMEEAERLCDRIMILDRGRVLVTGTPRELIARHIEPQVVEVYGPGIEAWVQRQGRFMACRVEQVGETTFCYTPDADPLLENLRTLPQLRFLHRPANLEDVFLRLTGRELRDE
jgi:lipooligosaccharide transport system ATP-binding protein